MWHSTTLEVGPDRYDMIPIPLEHNAIDTIAAIALRAGKNPAAAERFAAFLQGERARRILREAGLVRAR